ncbi:MAG: serine esterase [Proteobacteria bacterium]|jgi:phospholipase/carboxylesterase|nr:serine esterase [Pseudomonadota bacterium]
MIETALFKSHHIPSRKPSDKLMIVLHGKGDSLRPFKKFHQELRVKDMHFLLLNAPKKYLGGYSWYGDYPYQKSGVIKIRQKMLQLLSDLEAQGWKPENIHLLGFSQGCLVSSDVALHYPKKLGGVIGISGYFQFYPRWKKALAQNRRTPWLFTHGNQDDVLPIEDTKFGVGKLRLAGLKVDFVESNKDHVFEEREYPIIKRWLETKCLPDALPRGLTTY